jgi:hypothetical protein
MPTMQPVWGLRHDARPLQPKRLAWPASGRLPGAARCVRAGRGFAMSATQTAATQNLCAAFIQMLPNLKDDTWVKVTPETMPPSLLDVDVFIEGSPYYDGEHVERGFWDADTEQWCSNHDGAPLDSGLVVTWWRKGSLPPGTSGG